MSSDDVSDVLSLTEPDHVLDPVSIGRVDPDEDVVCLGLLRGGVLIGGRPSAGHSNVRDIDFLGHWVGKISCFKA